MADRGSGRFTLSVSEVVRAQVMDLALRAKSAGLGAAFTSALKVIHERLTSDPIAWGDQSNLLVHAGLTKCHRIYSILHVRFAVDKKKRIVYLVNVAPAPAGPLDTR